MVRFRKCRSDQLFPSVDLETAASPALHEKTKTQKRVKEKH